MSAGFPGFPPAPWRAVVSLPAYTMREQDGRWHVIEATVGSLQPIASANPYREGAAEELATIVRRANAARSLAAVARLLLAALVAYEAPGSGEALRASLGSIADAARHAVRESGL